MREHFATVLIAAFIAGCPFLPAEPDAALTSERFSIHVDPDHYELQEDASIELSYEYVNEGRHPFYLGSCLGRASDMLEKLVNNEWMRAYSPACPDVLVDPIRVEPGQRYSGTTVVPASILDSGWANEAWRVNEVDGTYRLRELIYLDWNIQQYDSRTLPSDVLVSNAFTIQVVKD